MNSARELDPSIDVFAKSVDELLALVPIRESEIIPT